MACLEWGRKIRTYFCFKCVSVHIWSLFWPIYRESQRWPMTRLLRLTWFWLSHSSLTLSSIWPRVPEVQGSPPGSSKLTQCVKPGMTPCSAKLCCLNILLFSTCIHLMLSRLLSLSFLWVILNSTSLQSLWCVTNFPPFNLPHPFLLKSHPSIHGNHFSPILPVSFFFSDIFSFLSGRTFLSDLPSLTISLSAQILLTLCLSLRLKTFQFSCHKLCSPAQLSKQGGVPFIPPHILRKEMGGRRALTLVFGHKQLSLIIVFLFSFPVPMEVRPDEHAIIRSSRPGSAGLGVQARSWDSVAFISMWVRSWFKHVVMGELTPGTQLSMGSAKRLYVLMAGFYMQWAFKTSAVKSRHRCRDLHLYIFTICTAYVSLLAPYLSSLYPGTCVWDRVEFPLECQRYGPNFTNYTIHVQSRRTLIRLPLGVYVRCAASDSHDRHWAFGTGALF